MIGVSFILGQIGDPKMVLLPDLLPVDPFVIPFCNGVDEIPTALLNLKLTNLS